MSPLNVYKASAGSGKTYALTMAYLTLLFNFPEAHRHILAVTFTNKAAGEMKDRILTRLFELSKTDESSRSDELEYLMESTGLAAGTIIRRSGQLLNRILNDYSGFSVGTIDKFFQSVIRAFTREIGIQPGYNLELDHERVLALAVDHLFMDIADEHELQSWLIRFAEDRMEESRSWNFRNDIIKLGMQLFRESFQQLFEDQDISVLNKDNLDLYLADIKQVEANTRKAIVRTGQEALDRLRKDGFEVEQFRLKGNSPPSLFRQAVEDGEMNFTPAKLDALDQQEKWLNKDAGAGMISLTENVLMPMLNKLYDSQVVLNTIQAIRQNFYTLGILGDIRDKVQSYLKENNLFLIADSSRFLHGIIGGNQVPFIYERTGNRYNHIMLDEFQDTSVFQYENFKPLLENALASGNDNLVVGDVKQSIYRWRNSDWKILSSDLETDFSHQEFRTHKLDRNFRSREQIIRFNNTVFQLAPEVLVGIIENELHTTTEKRTEATAAVHRFRSAYSDAVQQIPSRSMGSGGLVKMELFREEENMTFRDQVLSRIPEWIEEILEAGIEAGEAAILVRSRREGIMVAGKLLEHARITGDSHKFRLISSESLLLVHNNAVSLVISVLHYLLYPGDSLNNALLKYRYYQLGSLTGGGTDHLFDVSLPPEQYLPAGFMERIHQYRQLPLFELVETLISLFGLDQLVQDLPYLQAFQELVIEAQRRESLGIAEFLQYWEQHGSRKGIQISENSNAIRILTIHRAKGLEFKAVMVPFFNWEITTDQRKSNILWCDTAGTPFHRLPIVPVRFSGNMKHTQFSDFYYQERMKGYLDSLNLMYVALTRAVDVMFLGVPFPEEEGLRDTGDLMRTILHSQPENGPALESLEHYRSGDVITIGSMPGYEKKSVEKDQWQFVTYNTHSENRLLKVRMQSDAYFVDEEGIFRTEQVFGNMMHKVFSRIVTWVDVDPVLYALQKEGILSSRDYPVLREKIMDMISQSGVKNWFSEGEGRTVYNERSILCGDGTVIRPDRVIVEGNGVTVVDFKFGQFEKENYRTQVSNYMDQLKHMGYKPVKGYIWYVMLGKTVQIEET